MYKFEFLVFLCFVLIFFHCLFCNISLCVLVIDWGVNMRLSEWFGDHSVANHCLFKFEYSFSFCMTLQCIVLPHVTNWYPFAKYRKPKSTYCKILWFLILGRHSSGVLCYVLSVLHLSSERTWLHLTFCQSQFSCVLRRSWTAIALTCLLNVFHTLWYKHFIGKCYWYSVWLWSARGLFFFSFLLVNKDINSRLTLYVLSISYAFLTIP